MPKSIEFCEPRLPTMLRRFRAVVVCFLASVAASDSVRAQPVNLIAGVDNETDQNANQLPFLLPVQPTEIGEAMEDFRRFVGRKQWEKAFKHLEKVFNATSGGLVLTDSGILLPSRLIAREALLELPPAGQDAYRLFFDAEAKKLLEQAKDGEELNKLTQIFTRYLVTSVGDEAANKLGDLHFEAGNFAQAANAWRAVLEERPDSRIPRVRLRVKIALALAREQRWTEFREILKLVEEQHAAEKLTLGGKEVTAVDHLRRLLSQVKADSAVTPAIVSADGLGVDIPLKSNPGPLWQFRFFPPVDGQGQNPQQGLRLQQMWGNAQTSDLVPPTVANDTHLFVNLVGYDLAIELKSGKLAWRSGRFFDLPQKAQQGGLSNLEQFGIAAEAGRSWSVALDLKNLNQGRTQGGPKFDIVAREAETGKQVFSSKDAAELKDWTIRGRPVPAGDRVYVAGGKTNNPRELYVLSLNAKDGKLLWSTLIGSYTSEPNYGYGQMERGSQPSLLWHRDRLFVDTHAGSLVQLETITGQIEWGLNYASDRQQGGGRFWSPYGMVAERLTTGGPQMFDGILFLKGMRSTRLYAVDPLRPKVLWHRPISKTSNLIGVDSQRFYLGGEEISAFDRTTRKILWSVQVNLGTTYARPLMTTNRIYHFSSRGIHEIDKASGKVVHLFRGADLDSLGGELIVTPQALLTVSNLAVTAYPLSDKATVAESAPVQSDVPVSDQGVVSN